MKIFHVDRELDKPLEQQKKELEAQYKDFYYFHSDGRQIHFMSSGKKED